MPLQIPSHPTVEPVSRLRLGTVQFGQHYGKIHRSSPPTREALERLLDHAWACGVRAWDTAAAYGSAEERLGLWLKSRSHRPDIVSKVPPLPEALSPAEVSAWLRARLIDSLDRLGVDRLDAWLTHRAVDLERPVVAETLAALREEGRIGAYGASLYDPVEVAGLAAGASHLQVPLNVLDHRFAAPELLGSEWAIDVRSVLLQGVLLSSSNALPVELAPLGLRIDGLQALAAKTGTAALVLAMAAVLARPRVTRLVVGMLNESQIDANLNALDEAGRLPADVVAAAWALGDGLEAAQVDPRRWPGQRPSDG